MTDAAVTDVDAAGLERLLGAEPGLILVEFWARWCEPCRELRPQLEALARDHAHLCTVVAVDADSEPVLAERLRIRSLPTLVFFKSGRELHRFKGGALPPSVIQMIGRSTTNA